MPSRSLQKWRSSRADDLDAVVAAHAAVRGSTRGRNHATEQINLAYAVLLASQFQGFCRDLHSEAVDHIMTVITAPPLITRLVRARFIEGRKLDQGNASPSNIGADFARVELWLWPEVRQLHDLNKKRQEHLELLITWRNAIAHQDFDPGELGGMTRLRLQQVKRWRSVCNSLAQTLDRVVGQHAASLAGTAPW